jgi:hypothetical protein
MPTSHLPISSSCARRCPRISVATAARPDCIPSPTCEYSAGRVDIERYLRWLQDVRRYQPSTVSRRLSVVVGFYRVCVIDGILAHSPAGDALPFTDDL